MRDVDLANLEDGLMNIFKTAIDSDCNAEIISGIYNCLSNRMSEGALYIEEKRDGESNRVLSGEEWCGICQIQWKTTSTPIWREFCWKSLACFFATPWQERH